MVGEHIPGLSTDSNTCAAQIFSVSLSNLLTSPSPRSCKLILLNRRVVPRNARVPQIPCRACPRHLYFYTGLLNPYLVCSNSFYYFNMAHLFVVPVTIAQISTVEMETFHI